MRGLAEEADAQVERIRQSDGIGSAVRADVGDPAAVRAMFDEAERTYRGVDVLVNSAGTMQLAPIAETRSPTATSRST